MFTWICSIASRLIGWEAVCPPRVDERPKVLLKLAPSTVTLLYWLLRPPKLRPLVPELLPAAGVRRVKSCMERLMVGKRPIGERVMISWLPVRLLLNTLFCRADLTSTSPRLL